MKASTAADDVEQLHLSPILRRGRKCTFLQLPHAAKSEAAVDGASAGSRRTRTRELGILWIVWRFGGGMFHSLSLMPLLGIFILGAGAIWMAGVKLSNTTDVLSQRFGFGQALGGVILLAIATNLPEIAI